MSCTLHYHTAQYHTTLPPFFITQLILQNTLFQLNHVHCTITWHDMIHITHSRPFPILQWPNITNIWDSCIISTFIPGNRQLEWTSMDADALIDFPRNENVDKLLFSFVNWSDFAYFGTNSKVFLLHWHWKILFERINSKKCKSHFQF